MIKKRYIKRAYIEEAYCDKCGSLLKPTGMVLTTYPCQYPYVCTNDDCDYYTAFIGDERPGVVKYEFEDEENDEMITIEIPIQDLATPDLNKRLYNFKNGDFIHTIDSVLVEDVQYV